jgi:hypothetical protein
MADGNVTVKVSIDDSLIREQIRAAIRKAIAHDPDMLARFEMAWAESDVQFCRTEGDAS